jgi:hypothetical protein
VREGSSPQGRDAARPGEPVAQKKKGNRRIEPGPQGTRPQANGIIRMCAAARGRLRIRVKSGHKRKMLMSRKTWAGLGVRKSFNYNDAGANHFVGCPEMATPTKKKSHLFQ